MRAPIGMVSPLLEDIHRSLGVSSGLLGSITTIPLVCFALFSPFVPKIGKRLGNELFMLIAILALALGNYFRVFSFSGLLLGTCLVGLSIAVLNVLMPVTIAEKFPQKIGAMTSVYTFSMTFFSSLASGGSVTLAHKLGWQGALQSISLVAIMGAFFWLPAIKNMHKPKTKKRDNSSVWKLRGAWFLSCFMGIQSLLFYTTLTWVPSILMSHGLSQEQAGQLLGLMQLASLPTSYFAPILAYRLKRLKPLIFFMGFGFIFALTLLMIPSNNIYFLLFVMIITGLTSNMAFSLAVSLFTLKTRTPEQTAEISGMAQAFGYLLAAIGPIGIGYFHQLTHSWSPPIMVLMAFIVLMMYTSLEVDKRETIYD